MQYIVSVFRVTYHVLNIPEEECLLKLGSIATRQMSRGKTCVFFLIFVINHTI